VGQIGEDQLEDMAQRRGMDLRRCDGHWHRTWLIFSRQPSQAKSQGTALL
jgi:hypothetical protein